MAKAQFISETFVQANLGTGTDLTISKPDGAQEGDFLFLVLSRAISLTSVSFSGDLIKIGENLMPNATAIAYKIVTGSEPSEYIVSGDAEFVTPTAVRLICYRPIGETALDVAFVKSEHFSSSTSAATISPRDITTNTNGASVLIFWAAKGSAPLTLTPPNGYTKDVERLNSWNSSHAVFRKEIPTAGLESPGDIISDVSQDNLYTYVIAITPSDSIIINNVTWEPATGWDWIAYDGSLIPTNSVLHINSGTHTGSDGAATLTDSSKSYTIDELVGLRVRNTVTGATGIITANTATTITAPLSDGGTWSTGDTYYIEIALDSGDQMVYEKTTNLNGSVVLNSKGVPAITGITGTHTFDIKYRDATDSKVSATRTVTVT